MTIEVKPNFQSVIADDPAATAAGEVTPSRWNLGHKITQATARLLGRVTAGAGDSEELTAAQVKTFLGLGSAADASTGTASGQVPILDGNGQLATSVLPALALTDVFEVGSQAAMLALTAERGDIAIRTDLNKTFALATDAPGTLADWKELRTPTDVVLAIAGLTGTITAAQLKTALAISVADVIDASANGRSLIQAADYATMFGLLKVAATDTATGVVEKATVAEVRSSAADKYVSADLIETAAAVVTLTDATSVAINWDSFLVAQVTFAGNRTLANPSNVQPGTTRYIVVKGSDATARTISFGTNFKGDLPTGTVTSTSWLLIGLTALSTSHVVVTSCKAL